MSITSIEHYSKAVRNGGFDRLEKAIVDDYAGNNQEILGLAAGQDKNVAIVYDWINHHRQEILKHKPTRHYATDVADNNMTEFFLSGSNKYSYHPFFLQWLNKHAPAVGTGITVTGGAAKTVNNNE